jgi:hypothetical protein
MGASATRALQLLATLFFGAASRPGGGAGRAAYPPIPHAVHYDYPDIPWPLPSSLRREGNATAVVAGTVRLECGPAADGCDTEACTPTDNIYYKYFKIRAGHARRPHTKRRRKKA